MTALELKEARELLGMTLADMSAKLTIRKDALRKMEQGKTGIGVGVTATVAGMVDKHRDRVDAWVRRSKGL